MSTNTSRTSSGIEHRERAVRSAVWAAWADSLGFISELTDERGLLRRLGKNGPDLATPVEWRRRVGGRYGVEMTMPAGCYSDDTQLRLAVARSVTGAGFDVEAFSRVELPVWPSYALGGGRASKAAAANMAKANSVWFANFYGGWTDSGGNGAAMRIQPHVWATADPSSPDYLGDVLLDAITTHGHPRALFGAVLHAAALGETMATGKVPGPIRWQDLLVKAVSALEFAREDVQFDAMWRPSWEGVVGRPFVDAWAEVADECESMLAAVAELFPWDAASHNVDVLSDHYRNLVYGFDLDGDKLRGSGTHTVIAALALSAAVGPDVSAAAVAAARAVGTDTDTVATMAAAVSGAADGAAEGPDVLDREYIVAHAERLSSIAAGESTERFSYPDLLTWVPPRTQSDACGLAEDRPALAGLGWCDVLTDFEAAEYRDNVWRWMRMDFGQTVLVKQRTKLRPLPDGARPVRRTVTDPARDIPIEPGPPTSETAESPDRTPADDVSPSLAAEYAAAKEIDRPRGARQEELSFDHTERVRTQLAGDPSTDIQRQNSSPALPDDRPRDRHVDVDRMLEWVRQRHFSDEALGYALRRIAEVGSVEQIVAFSVAIHTVADRSRHRSTDER